MTTLVSLIQEGASIDAIAQHVDGLSEAQRIEQMNACGAKPQAKLGKPLLDEKSKRSISLVKATRLSFTQDEYLPVFNFFRDFGVLCGQKLLATTKHVEIYGSAILTEDGDNGELALIM